MSGAHVDQGHQRVLGNRQLVGDQPEGVLHGEGFDIDDLGGETAEIQRGDPDINILGARGGQQDFHHLGVVLDRTSTSKSMLTSSIGYGMY